LPLIRAVLDANVLASAIAAIRLPTSTPGELLRRWRRRAYTLVVSDVILDETARTLRKPYFQRFMRSGQAESAVRLVRAKAERTSIVAEVSGVATHPEDDLILATAVSAKVRYLVTGDAQLQALRRYRGVTIVSPRVFLSMLSQRDPTNGTATPPTPSAER
jgi:putative PIN family toxin of toxin-antitoxin system